MVPLTVTGSPAWAAAGVVETAVDNVNAATTATARILTTNGRMISSVRHTLAHRANANRAPHGHRAVRDRSVGAIEGCFAAHQHALDILPRRAEQVGPR